LIDDLPQRLAKGAVKFQIKAAACQRRAIRPKDPTQGVADDRKVVASGHADDPAGPSPTAMPCKEAAFYSPDA